jgi:hypothetical protein
MHAYCTVTLNCADGKPVAVAVTMTAPALPDVVYIVLARPLLFVFADEAEKIPPDPPSAKPTVTPETELLY